MTSKAARATFYDSAGRELSFQGKATYAVAMAPLGPAATATDIFIIEGSSTKTIRVISFNIYTIQTTLGANLWFLIKRSTADTTGTFVGDTVVPLDSANAGATANRVGHFTANPGALGTAVGTVVERRLTAYSTTITANDYDQKDLLAFMAASLLDQPITLRGVAQTLALNFNGAAIPAGMTVGVNMSWIEE